MSFHPTWQWCLVCLRDFCCGGDLALWFWSPPGGPVRADVLTQESPRQRLPASCPTAFLTQAARSPYFTEGSLTPTKLNDCFLPRAQVDHSTQTWGLHSSDSEM